jgi:hypothetical protein
MRMADKLQGEVTKDIVQPLMMRSLYSIGEEICFPDPAVKLLMNLKNSKNKITKML